MANIQKKIDVFIFFCSILWHRGSQLGYHILDPIIAVVIGFF